MTNRDTVAHPPFVVTPTHLLDQIAAELDSARSIPVLTGPTGSGKTDLLIPLRERLGGDRPFDVISVDAFQVYRRMEIGTAKPSTALRSLIKHHLIDIREPAESWSAGEFAVEAMKTIEMIRKDGGRVLLCGGCGLYLSALIHGFHPAADADLELRRTTSTRAELIERLRRNDSISADLLHAAPLPRIVRAIEMVEGAGMTLDRIRAAPLKRPPYEFSLHTIPNERPALYRRIDARVDRMIEEGLVSEVERLREEGVGRHFPSQKAIGYREAHAFLEGEIDLLEMIRLIKRNTRRYAKRQETWMRGKNNCGFRILDCGLKIQTTDGTRIQSEIQNPKSAI